MLFNKFSFQFVPLAFVAAMAMAGCDAEPSAPPTMNGDVEVLELDATLVDDTVVSGGALLIDLGGTELLVPQSVIVTFKGRLEGAEIDAFSIAEFAQSDDGGLRLTSPWDELTDVLGVSGDATFEGDLEIVVEDIGGRLEGRGGVEGTQIVFVSTLTPEVSAPSSFSVFLNDVTSWDAEGILRPGEGQSWLEVRGDFEAETGAEHAVDARIPVVVGDQGRSVAQTNWLPYVFGVRPGTFSGTLTPINAHTSGGERAGSSAEVSVGLASSEIDGWANPAASRGEIATLVGRGFIAPDPERGQSMFFVLEGTYYLMDGSELDLSGDEVVRIAPEEVPSFTEARIVLRTETEERGGTLKLRGITATPGTFQGTITPVLIDGADTVMGVPWSGEFTITPTLQVVYIKFLPGFSTSLDTFGLRNVEPEIRARILEVVERDYHDFHVAFTDQEPSDFIEYSLIEVGGPDPNNAGLFGLDNTAGKDTGNIRLNDWIGGTNAESGELGYYIFGGVFIESFIAFSPSLDSDSEVASASFDELFAPFMPRLGGTVIDAAEWPEGPRSAQIDRAVHGFGSVIGNTITHEIGHSLGLAFFPEDEFGPGNRFHNDFDEPGAIMDSGGNRSFEERAELDEGVTPEFNSRNRAYLQRILPLP